ncbi:MAG TPA: thioredoxin family protein [Candidatus Binatia bacterium]|jgi:thioredoxin 1|nr:thioredoxin family protein [Candidatus Binatia bacterium]
MAPDVTGATFEAEVLRSPLPVPGPVLRVLPGDAAHVDRLAGEYAGRPEVVRRDADASPEAPARFAVRAVPNFAVVKSGRVVDQILGAVPKRRLVDAIERALAG